MGVTNHLLTGMILQVPLDSHDIIYICFTPVVDHPSSNPPLKIRRFGVHELHLRFSAGAESDRKRSFFCGLVSEAMSINVELLRLYTYIYINFIYIYTYIRQIYNI